MANYNVCDVQILNEENLSSELKTKAEKFIKEVKETCTTCISYLAIGTGKDVEHFAFQYKEKNSFNSFRVEGGELTPYPYLKKNDGNFTVELYFAAVEHGVMFVNIVKCKVV